MDRDAELVRLRAENTRLIGLLEAHGIAWRLPEPDSLPTAVRADVNLVQIRRLESGALTGT